MRNPRHILITGASSGLGAALALNYAAPDMCLSLHGRNAERLARIADLVRQRGANVEIHTGDVSDQENIARWITDRDQVTHIDLVIANAGISAGTASGIESTDQIAAIFATNVSGVFNTVQPALSLMTRHRHGQIAIISSLASFRGFAGAPAYCASKAAVRIYGEALRGDMMRHNVDINIVCPGFIKTPMTDTNRFPMPFMISAAKAAQIIRTGLERNRARIAFPWPLYTLTRAYAALPEPIIDFLARWTPRK